MKLEKIKKTYNDYKAEFSFGQLQAIVAALEANHADPLADELLAEFKWYLEQVPGPGEEEDEGKGGMDGTLKAPGEEDGAPGADGAGADGAGGDDFDIPLPPAGEGGGDDLGPKGASGGPGPVGEPGEEGEEGEVEDIAPTQPGAAAKPTGKSLPGPEEDDELPPPPADGQ